MVHCVSLVRTLTCEVLTNNSSGSFMRYQRHAMVVLLVLSIAITHRWEGLPSALLITRGLNWPTCELRVGSQMADMAVRADSRHMAWEPCQQLVPHLWCMCICNDEVACQDNTSWIRLVDRRLGCECLFLNRRLSRQLHLLAPPRLSTHGTHMCFLSSAYQRYI